MANPIDTPLPGPTSAPVAGTINHATPDLHQETWKLELLRGKTYGFSHTIVTHENGHYTTSTHEEALIRRAGSSLRTIDDSAITEDDNGIVLGFDRSIQGPQLNGHWHGNRSGENLVIHSPGQDDYTLSCPAITALGPFYVSRQRDSITLAPNTTSQVKAFSQEHWATPNVIKTTIVKKEDHALPDGTTKNLWRVTTEEEDASKPLSTSWEDDSRVVQGTETVIPGLGTIIEKPSTATECQTPLEGVELFAASLIRPDRSLGSPQRLGKAVYQLSCPGLATELPLWKQDAVMQEINKSAPGTAQISVWANNFVPESAGYEMPAHPIAALDAYLRPSRYLECDAPEIKLLANDAVKGENNPVIAARRIETYVRNYITRKDLRLGFLTARATAHAREGDCKEHAVLCAAMGRAVGIPTRCVVGLCYVPPNEQLYANVSGDVSHGVFGFHMWAEAYISEGQWMPMDAATYGYDVGHIALFKTALDDDNPDFETTIAPVVGNLKIKILDTDLNNRPLPTPKPQRDPALEKAPPVD